ncbi:ABC transporter ATP-binding protein [Siminovitchia terrae]|uniref:ABC transporter ATP-binding protein n=1 Tax=Siminovitchia terrae TaxID=1914933 RepID=A0A429XBV9_SIMTE|nr:ABC transporter ATP-binding protein [Siminovitchia terrae]RST60945.1 ABC transporter ATP-binding protein [Siminovitchia terrae]GIN90804.1 ABC transporter ATP-binding protein [Siminovitchia terrae]
MIKHIKPYSLYIVAVVLLTLGGIMLELLLPTLMANVVDIGIVNGDMPYILKTGGLMLIFALVAIILMTGVSFFASKTALGFGRDIRRSLFVNVEKFSLQAFDKIGTASLITRSTNDVKQVQDVLNMILRMMTRAPLMLIGGIIMAVTREPGLSIVFLGALPLLALLIFVISRKAIPLFVSLQKKTDKLNLIVRENLTGVRVIRAFNNETHEKERFDTANLDFRDTGIKVNKMMAVLFPVMMIVMNFTSVAIVWFGAVRIDQEIMQVGNLMAFLQYSMMILMSLIMLSFGFIMIPRAKASMDRINEVLKMENDIADPEHPKSEHGELGSVEFRDVTFRYAGAEKPVLQRLSFTAKKGKTTAIIGSTGSGKSTLIKLIPRFYDVERGSVLIDGIDVRDMPQEELRAKIGYVPQKAALFSGTVAENLQYGNEGASEKEMWEALDISQATEFVKEKQEGINLMIEQAGANLSGGQKQRLSIARALIRKPEIYLFDDSFSALDYKTDAKLRSELTKITKDATIILVAQRVSTVTDADQIIVLEEGEIAGIGTHQELLAENRIYQEIVSSQRAEEEGA